MANDHDVYDLTHKVFDSLDARGVPITEPIATIVRAVAVESVDLMAMFTEEGEDGPA